MLAFAGYCPKCHRHDLLVTNNPSYDAPDGIGTPAICGRCYDKSIEHSWVITGRQTGRLWFGSRQMENRGGPVQVEFDPEWTIARHREKRDVLGWYHTHPNMPAFISSTDLSTMQAWVGCLGVPLLCFIEGNQGLRGWVFDSDESKGIPLRFSKLVGNVVTGVTHGKYVRTRRVVQRQRRNTASR